MLRPHRLGRRRSGTILFPALAILIGAGGPVSQQGDGPWGRAAIDSFVDGARQRALEECARRGLVLPLDFLAFVDADPVRRASVYGCRRNSLPVLLALRSLEIDLGEQMVRREYPQLALAFAIQGSYASPRSAASGWNDGEGAEDAAYLPDIAPRPPLDLRIPGDPRVRVDTKDAHRALGRDDHIVNFLEDHAPIEVEVSSTELPPLEYDDKGVAKPRGKPVKVKTKVLRPLVAADVIASPSLQAEFNAYLREKGVGEVQLDCGDTVVSWDAHEAVRDPDARRRVAAAFELFRAAYRATGRMPAERDRAPTPAESMAWLVRNDRHAFSDEERAARSWPKFPLDAPWPVLLMLAADDQPLREREDIWLRFRDHGEFRTYGEYIGGIAQQFDMQSARRVAPFAFDYGSIQMMWKDGGVCGTMGNIGARTYRICGVPASTAGQPGHCAIVFMEHDPKTSEFRCRGGQYATGGDEVTTVHAGWNYDDVGGRRGIVFHQSVAWGVNHGLASFVDALVLRRMWDATDPSTRGARCVEFVSATMARNPFALADVEAAITAAPDSAVASAVLDAFDAQFDRIAKAGEFGLYRSTVRDLAHARILALPAPDDDGEQQRLLAALERQGCELPKLLARTWRAVDGETGFTRHCVGAVERYLAAPVRARNRREAERFAARVSEWGSTVQGSNQRQAWATELLLAFAGKEALRIKGKALLDPTVAMLCKLAGREPPIVGG